MISVWGSIKKSCYLLELYMVNKQYSSKFIVNWIINSVSNNKNKKNKKLDEHKTSQNDRTKAALFSTRNIEQKITLLKANAMKHNKTQNISAQFDKH